MRFRQPSHRQASHRAECRFCVRPDLGLIAPAADGLLSTKSCTTLGELAKPLTPPDKPDRLARGQHRLGHSLCAPPRAWPRSAFIPPGPIPRPPVRFGIFEAGLRGPRELVWNDEGFTLGWVPSALQAEYRGGAARRCAVGVPGFHPGLGSVGPSGRGTRGGLRYAVPGRSESQGFTLGWALSAFQAGQPAGAGRDALRPAPKGLTLGSAPPACWAEQNQIIGVSFVPPFALRTVPPPCSSRRVGGMICQRLYPVRDQGAFP